MNTNTLGAVVSLLIAGLLCSAGRTAGAPERPAISGVVGIRLLCSDIEKSQVFYGKLLGLRECHSDAVLCFQLNTIQKIELDAVSQQEGSSHLVFVAFSTNDASALRRHMAGNGLGVGNEISLADETRFFQVPDPENHALRFVQHPTPLTLAQRGPANQISNRMIHTGYPVHDRAAMDHFYKSILGFHVYWHGGRKDDETDWVDMQVPDGTDWIEYMLNVPANADHRLLGVMNHIALGVPDIHAAEKQLRANGWHGDEQPKIGRDGKWQLNLYDPDQTRVELMEFTPAKEPCCSPYTGPHPKP